MRNLQLLLLLVAALACKPKTNLTQALSLLELDYNQAPTPEKAQSLVKIYRDAAAENPNDHARCLDWLTKAAALQFTKLDDAAPAARWLDDALNHHAAGQNLSAAAGLYARILTAHNYKSAAADKLQPADVDKMRANLLRNTAWLDSSLAKLSGELMANPANLDKAKANEYVQIAEAYADLVKPTKPDQYVSLTMQAAALAKTSENFNKATALYYSVFQQLPQHPKAPTALFMFAFVLENDLLDLPKAKAGYEEFLQKFPNDKDYVDDAQMALKNLGKSPEELIKEFERKGKK